ncbi:hypothetical protein [Dactylosporangium roseum]|nr:hypothetical protein [Dactylosporangium roseum]
MATATYDVATATGGADPAGAVWWLYRHAGGPLRLADLADHVLVSTAGRR